MFPALLPCPRYTVSDPRIPYASFAALQLPCRPSSNSLTTCNLNDSLYRISVFRSTWTSIPSVNLQPDQTEPGAHQDFLHVFQREGERCGRWQVELVFKRLKSLLALGHLRKTDDQSARAGIQGKLFVAFLLEALLRQGESFFPWGYPLLSA